MGRLIDEDILIDSIPDLSVFEEEDFCTSDMIHLIEDAPTVEAISKADYENRLKADMVAMLTEIQLEIEEMDSGCGWEGYRPTAQVIGLIQQKIDKLKEDKNGENNN